MTKIIMLCHTPSWKTIRSIWSVLRNTEDCTLTIVRTKESCAANRKRGIETLRLRPDEEFVMMDDDVIVRPGWFRALRKELNYNVGMVGMALRNPWITTRLKHLKRSFWFSNRVPGEVQNLIPAVVLCRHDPKIIPDVRYVGSQVEDTDWIMQYKQQGHKLVVSPEWVYHIGGKINAAGNMNLALFMKKWGVIPHAGLPEKREGILEAIFRRKPR